jgi:hypothetical protein
VIERRKANWIDHISDSNCLLKHIIEGEMGGGIEVMGRQGQRREQLLDDPKETRGYWKFKENHTLWVTCFGKGY